MMFDDNPVQEVALLDVSQRGLTEVRHVACARTSAHYSGVPSSCCRAALMSLGHRA